MLCDCFSSANERGNANQKPFEFHRTGELTQIEHCGQVATGSVKGARTYTARRWPIKAQAYIGECVLPKTIRNYFSFPFFLPPFFSSSFPQNTTKFFPVLSLSLSLIKESIKVIVGNLYYHHTSFELFAFKYRFFNYPNSTLLKSIIRIIRSILILRRSICFQPAGLLVN